MPTVPIKWTYGAGPYGFYTSVTRMFVNPRAGRDAVVGGVVDIPDGAFQTNVGASGERLLHAIYGYDPIILPEGVSFTPSNPLASMPSHAYHDTGSFDGTITFPDNWTGAAIRINYLHSNDGGGEYLVGSYSTSWIEYVTVTRRGRSYDFYIRTFPGGYEVDLYNALVGPFVESIRMEMDGITTYLPVTKWAGYDIGQRPSKFFETTHTFTPAPESSAHTGIKFTPVNVGGSLGVGAYVNMAPFTDFDFFEDMLDASRSYSATGEIVAYEWSQRPAGGIDSDGYHYVLTGFDPQHAKKTTLESALPGEASKTSIGLEIQTKMKDASGAEFLYPAAFNANDFPNINKNYFSHRAIELFVRPDMIIDRRNVRLTAAQKPAGVTIYRTARFTSTREKCAVFPGARRPSLTFGPKGEIRLLQITDGDDAWKLYESKDSGGTFELMAETPFTEEEFKYLDGCSLKSGGIAIVGIHLTTEKACFSYTHDGVNWSDVVDIEYIPYPRGLTIDQEPLTENLIITNGYDFARMTHNFGETWESI